MAKYKRAVISGIVINYWNRGNFCLGWRWFTQI